MSDGKALDQVVGETPEHRLTNGPAPAAAPRTVTSLTTCSRLIAWVFCRSGWSTSGRGPA
ncbi:hypothetical protein [Streptosporangium canum]|uniref:hypothetical protein n=1 Tax=Streptosporangium canum TaxID=324952 RepID=UPI0037B0CA77